MKRLLLTLCSVILLASPMLLLTSCAKENENHRLTVVVTVNDETRVPNANVHLYVPVSDTYIKGWIDQTDDSGEVQYKFKNKVIVELTATKGSFKGCSFAEVERGDNTVYVNLRPWSEREENGCLGSGS